MQVRGANPSSSHCNDPLDVPNFIISTVTYIGYTFPCGLGDMPVIISIVYVLGLRKEMQVRTQSITNL